MAEAAVALSDLQRTQLGQQTLVLLATIDAENGFPDVRAISWVHPMDGSRIRFAVNQRSATVTNIGRHPLTTLTFFCRQTVYTMYGRASLVTDDLPGVPFRLACFEVKLESIRDAMFHGSRISVQPEFENTYDERAAARLDGQVLDAMKKA